MFFSELIIHIRYTYYMIIESYTNYKSWNGTPTVYDTWMSFAKSLASDCDWNQE